LPQTPLGELTALPRPLAAVSDLTSKGKGMGRGMERGGEEECLTYAGGVKVVFCDTVVTWAGLLSIIEIASLYILKKSKAIASCGENET